MESPLRARRQHGKALLGVEDQGVHGLGRLRLAEQPPILPSWRWHRRAKAVPRNLTGVMVDPVGRRYPPLRLRNVRTHPEEDSVWSVPLDRPTPSSRGAASMSVGTPFEVCFVAPRRMSPAMLRARVGSLGGPDFRLCALDETECTEHEIKAHRRHWRCRVETRDGLDDFAVLRFLKLLTGAGFQILRFDTELLGDTVLHTTRE